MPATPALGWRQHGRARAALLLALLAACSGSDEQFALDGSARLADDEGIVTAVDGRSLTLDGERRYELADAFVTFSSVDLSMVTLSNTQHQYAQLGLDGDRVVWIGTVARPLRTDPPRVVYVGEVEAVDDGRLTFSNGTVFRLEDGVDAAGTVGRTTQVRIDPEEGVVTEVQP